MGLMHALRILGYKPYHMKTCFETGASHINVLNDAIRAKYHGEGAIYGKDEFDRWFSDYDVRLPSKNCSYIPGVLSLVLLAAEYLSRHF